MPIHPNAIGTATFRRRWRGYDRRQVQALLHRLGQDYSAAIDTIAELSDHADQPPGDLRAPHSVDASGAPPATADDTPQPSDRPRRDDTPSTPAATGCRAPADSFGAQRIQAIETELVRLRARLALMERIGQLEDEITALRATPDAISPGPQEAQGEP